jgi:hypothetical protein
MNLEFYRYANPQNIKLLSIDIEDMKKTAAEILV